MSVFLYREKDSASHRLDPRVKITLLLAFFVAAVLAHDLMTIGTLLAIMLALFLITDSSDNLRRMGFLFLLVTGMTFLLWTCFYGDGRADLDHRLAYAAMMSLRFLFMLMSGLLFLSITSLEDFANGLMLLRVPYGVAFTVSLSFRLVNVFMSTGFLIVEAQRVRGNDATRGSILKRMRAYAPLLAPLILNGIKRAETLYLALESKGFSPSNRVDMRGRYRINTVDVAVLVLVVILSAALVAYRLLVVGLLQPM